RQNQIDYARMRCDQRWPMRMDRCVATGPHPRRSALFASGAREAVMPSWLLKVWGSIFERRAAAAPPPARMPRVEKVRAAPRARARVAIRCYGTGTERKYQQARVRANIRRAGHHISLLDVVIH